MERRRARSTLFATVSSNGSAELMSHNMYLLEGTEKRKRSLCSSSSYKKSPGWGGKRIAPWPRTWGSREKVPDPNDRERGKWSHCRVDVLLEEKTERRNRLLSPSSSSSPYCYKKGSYTVDDLEETERRKRTLSSSSLSWTSSRSFSQGYRSSSSAPSSSPSFSSMSWTSSSSSYSHSSDSSGVHLALMEMAKKNFTSSYKKAILDDVYVQQEPLGKGGCGTVFGGYRRADSLPVAIKYIPKEKVTYTEVTVDGNLLRIPTEVLLQRIVAGDSVGESAAVSLLDWIDLGQQVVLVLERPVPSMDLFNYIMERGGSLPEHEAKSIVEQLVDALIEFHQKGVVHRDIKLENIILQTGSQVPVVRVIDFGCSCAQTDEEYTDMAGTFDYFPPEFFGEGSYRAVPYSVWQLGVVMYTMLFGRFPFNLFDDITFQEPQMNNEQLSQCGQAFLKHCLLKDPVSRATLPDLLFHPWINL